MARPIHVCIITTAHPIDDVRVNSKFAHAFRGAGFKVSWVGPGHAFFDRANYNQDGIHFVLAPPIRNRLDRVLSVGRVKCLAAKVRDVDVYYAPDPDSAPLAIRLGKQNNAKVIFDIHEIYHGALMDRWLMGRHLGPIRELVRRRIGRICSRCDLVLGVSNSVLDPYFQDPDRRMVVRSCAPSWFAEGPPADVCSASHSYFSLMHGKGSLQRGTLKVLDAVVLAAREAANLRVVMLTNGEPDLDPAAQVLMSRVKGSPTPEVLDLRKGVPMQDMPDILRSCDVGLIAYDRNLGVDSLPNRIFEYMALGIPIIAPEYSVEIARIIKTEKCGVLADFEDLNSIAMAIVRLSRDPALCQQMGKCGRKAFLVRHNWEVEVRPLLERIQAWFSESGSA